MKRLFALIAGLKAFVVAAVPSFGAIQFQDSPDADEAAWTAVNKAGKDEAFQDYLARFPTGRHSEEAFRQLLERELLAARFKDEDDKGRPDAFGPPGRPAIGPPGQSGSVLRSDHPSGITGSPVLWDRIRDREAEMGALDRFEGAGRGYDIDDNFPVRLLGEGTTLASRIYLAAESHPYLKPYGLPERLSCYIPL